MSRTQSNDERALRRLIKRSTRQRNWALLLLLFEDLGRLFEEEEAATS